MRRKKAEGSSAVAGGDGRITPMDVQQVEFRLAFRGYNERDVDAFLDRITEDLAAAMEENQRLRAGGAVAPPAPIVADVSSARSEAERIVAEAREEAARIVRDAEARAAASGAPSGDTRAAVAPFLNTEREFLQSLGSLVQGHAEEIKHMVLALRARSEAATLPAPAPATAEPSLRATPATVVAEEDSSDEAPVTASEDAATVQDEVFAPISVPDSPDDAVREEPATAPAPPATLRQDSGERSLRELFWGED